MPSFDVVVTYDGTEVFTLRADGFDQAQGFAQQIGQQGWVINVIPDVEWRHLTASEISDIRIRAVPQQ